jgi:hypothetical protein
MKIDINEYSSKYNISLKKIIEEIKIGNILSESDELGNIYIVMKQVETKKKLCKSCNNSKTLDLFGKDRYTTDGLTIHCKVCRNARARENSKKSGVYKRRNDKFKSYRDGYYKKRKNSLRSKNLQLIKDFNISLKDYNLLLEKQKGVCGICLGKNDSTRIDYFCVDHCHATNNVRGLLCSNCNRALGLFGDNITNLKNAINYLERFENE